MEQVINMDQRQPLFVHPDFGWTGEKQLRIALWILWDESTCKSYLMANDRWISACFAQMLSVILKITSQLLVANDIALVWLLRFDPVVGGRQLQSRQASPHCSALGSPQVWWHHHHHLTAFLEFRADSGLDVLSKADQENGLGKLKHRRRKKDDFVIIWRLVSLKSIVLQICGGQSDAMSGRDVSTMQRNKYFSVGGRSFLLLCFSVYFSDFRSASLTSWEIYAKDVTVVRRSILLQMCSSAWCVWWNLWYQFFDQIGNRCQ